MSTREFFTLVGFLAGTLTTLAFVPQVLHSFRTKSVDGISWAMLISFTVGVTLWLVYGLYLVSWPMIIANSVTLALVVPLIVMKVRYGAREEVHHEDAKTRR